MFLQERTHGGLPSNVLAFALGIWGFCGSSAVDAAGVDDGKCQLCGKAHHGTCGPGFGTLGYGPPGVFLGFQGFSLKFCLGYGYGAKALGVGAFGGYPFYGGPGYPHPWPHLNRFCGITPFPYFGGPGYSGPPSCNFFGEPGQLVINENVVGEGDRGDQAFIGGYVGWIIANARPGSELTLYVRKLSDGKSRAVTVRLP